MTTKYLIYTGIFLLFGACSNKAIYYNPDQKRSIYFNWDLSKYVSNVAPDTVFFSFAIYEEKEVIVSRAGRNLCRVHAGRLRFGGTSGCNGDHAGQCTGDGQDERNGKAESVGGGINV